ncbi:hypothetical protein F4778DRAFT_789528 [Xylariomycetidae sp. FL2044]|nr:hypothetical protein F4778DRAFT_802499 [Xylariomycetidae sp. FL2044]KAH9904805.1 hypothetical protein F4778DRAFT_789528 [Xylariomycetidae sp. FL2044]
MVCLKNILVVGASLLSFASAAPTDALHDEASPASVRALVDAAPRHDAADSREVDIAARVAGRMTLQWSPQGRIVFLLGFQLPQPVLDSLQGLGAAGPARALFNEFRTWLGANAGMWTRTTFDGATATGGIYGRGDASVQNDYGFGIQLAPADAGQVGDIVDNIARWASQFGGLVQRIQRSDDFVDQGIIGSGGSKKLRSRSDTCPAYIGLLKYATGTIPDDLDINKNFAAGGTCGS